MILDPSLLEATHESLIPLEEEEGVEAGEHAHLVDHVISLARDLARADGEGTVELFVFGAVVYIVL